MKPRTWLHEEALQLWVTRPSALAMAKGRAGNALVHCLLPLSCSSMPWEGTREGQNFQAIEAFASLGFCRGEWEAEGAVLR